MKIYKFRKLLINKQGNSGLECWLCESDAKYFLVGNGHYCSNCKTKIQKEQLKPWTSP